MRRWLRVVATGIAVAVGVVMMAPHAGAAGRLMASDPAPKEEVSQRPGWVTLAFDTTVKKSVVKILVLDSDGRNVVVGDLIYQGSTVMVQLNNALPKGTYTVKYQVDRKDGQPQGGAFQFAYGKGKWTDVDASWSGTAEQPPEMANPDPMATGPVVTPTTSAPVVEVEDPSGSPVATETAATPSETAETAAPATPTPGAQAGSAIGWVLGGVVVVAAAAVGGWLLLRRRRG